MTSMDASWTMQSTGIIHLHLRHLLAETWKLTRFKVICFGGTASRTCIRVSSVAIDYCKRASYSSVASANLEQYELPTMESLSPTSADWTTRLSLRHFRPPSIA